MLCEVDSLMEKKTSTGKRQERRWKKNIFGLIKLFVSMVMPSIKYTLLETVSFSAKLLHHEL